MLSTSSTTKAGIAIHFEKNPTVAGTKFVSTNGTEALEVTSLFPATPTVRVVNEGSAGRYRLELEKSGTTQTYFLTVFQARASSGTSLSVSSSEDATTMSLTLQHPTLGSAKVVFNKGATSTGGQFAYSATQTVPTALNALATTVQAISVTDSGVAWNGQTVIPAPTPPTNVKIVQ
jgi:hypothetical protein